MDAEHSGPLPAPAVAPEEYDEAYYREWCAGYETWTPSEGGELHPRYAFSLRRAGLSAGEVLVDVGCGRGELLVAALQAGAARAVGVEYSESAVRLSRQTLAAHAVGEGAEVVQADARALPLPDGLADLVTLLDVVEHLTETELARALTEARRVLRPGGRLLVHTFPNRLVYSVTYRLQRLARPGRRRAWPADPRLELERRMHVNEQTAGSLRRALRAAGLERVDVRHGEWIHIAHIPDERARALHHRLAAHRLTAPLGRADLWGTANAPDRVSGR